MRKDLSTEQRQLADFMSDISERCYSASWMANLEYVLWNSLITGPRKYGHDLITQEDINSLKQLSKMADCWIKFDGHLGETAINLTRWQKKFQFDTKNSPELLRG